MISDKKRGKTILILGNGFDLAHNLPTKYSNFLDFCKIVEKFFKDDIDIFGVLVDNMQIFSNTQNLNNTQSLKENKINEFKEKFIKKLKEKGFKNTEIIYKDFCCAMDKSYQGKEANYYLSDIYQNISNNVWYDYLDFLYTNSIMKGENWIDFETEICHVIKEIDQMKLSLVDEWRVLSRSFDNSTSDKITRFGIMFDKKFEDNNIFIKHRYQFTMRDFIKEIYHDLEKLIRALELYLSEFVEKNEIEIKKKIPEIESISPDYIINFNYTHTYETSYEKNSEETKVYHIHGKVDSRRNMDDSDIVLGIDEYWTDEEKDKHTNFTIFKKFAQRIQKKTGNNIYRYLKEIKAVGTYINGTTNMTDEEKNKFVSEVYIFGHSLDITDKDILSGFIGNDVTSVKIYCRDKETEGELIANTIKLIGEDKLIEKSNRTIANLEFVIQTNIIEK